MPLSNEDLFVVQRGNSIFKVNSSTLKQEYSSTANVSVGPNPPLNPVQGDLWWSTLEGNLFIWYDETAVGGDSAQWVDASPAFIEIDYTRIENYIDFSVFNNAVAQIKPGENWVTVNPVNGKGVVTVDLDLTDYLEYQQRQDGLIEELQKQIEDLLNRVDELEDNVYRIPSIDGGYPNPEGVFDKPDCDGGGSDPSGQTDFDPIADGGANNAEGKYPPI